MILLLAWAGSATGEAERWIQELNIDKPRTRVAAPDFALPGPEGEMRALERYEGDLILLNFWATWCKPCRDEMPALESLWQEYGDRGLTVIGVNVDRGGPDKVRAMAEKLGISFPVLLDPDGEVRNRYNVTAFPQTYLIGRDGRFLGKALGEREWASRAGHELIRHFLKRSGGAKN
ncbi:TlpA disulfide reductase family protein [Thiohalorhabdus denitrificans]|nr:TlpA disulfide reductase family protein [Thiohalorhabdus denitrificans]